MVAKGIVTVLDLGGAADVQTHGCVELEGVAAGGCFRIAEHNADFLTQLVDENAAGAGFGDVGGEFAESLGHEAGLEAHFIVSHLSLNLCAGSEGCHRVNDHYVYGAAADKVVCNF